MILQHLPSEFQKALPILRKIQQAGFEAYFVGGCVRDVLLGRPIHDVDIASSAYPQEIKKIFNHTIDIGIEHGTVLVLENESEYEITTFRTEDAYVNYRRPSHVSFVRSLEEDLKRRDFTVNALTLDQDGRVIDIFGGLEDLDKGILRAVGKADERFQEDALRIMRGFRFSASLGFQIEEKTLSSMAFYAPLLEKISVERSFIEFDKLLQAPKWRQGLTLFLTSKAYDYLPMLSGKDIQIQQFIDCWSDDFLFSSSEQAWAAFLIALEVSSPISFLKKWKTSTQFQKTVDQIVTIFTLRLNQEVDKPMVYQFGKELLMAAESLRQGRQMPVDFTRIVELDKQLTIHDKHELAVNGGILMKELGFQAGPELGKALKAIEKRVVLGELENDKSKIFKWIREEKG